MPLTFNECHCAQCAQVCTTQFADQRASARHLASAGCRVAERGELAGLIFTIDCTLRASARHLALAGCRVAARGELAGFIFTIDCTLRASARHLASAGCRVAARGELAGFIFIIDSCSDLHSAAQRSAARLWRSICWTGCGGAAATNIRICG